MKTTLVMVALVMTVAPALAGERLECFLTGSTYKNETYPQGRQVIWYVDSDVLRQNKPGMQDAAVPLATMKVVRRDQTTLIAEWSHVLPEGSTYRLVIDMPTGDATEYSSAHGRQSGADGSCKLVVD